MGMLNPSMTRSIKRRRQINLDPRNIAVPPAARLTAVFILITKTLR
jgi:hypothetical protein